MSRAVEPPSGRPRDASWAVTRLPREELCDRLKGSALLPPGDRRSRRQGLALLLDWLEQHPGSTWQDRWIATGVETDGRGLRPILEDWLRVEAQDVPHRLEAMGRAVSIAITADVIRPSLSWVVCGNFRRGSLIADLMRARDRDGLARLRAYCDADPAYTNTHLRADLIRFILLLGGFNAPPSQNDRT